MPVAIAFPSLDAGRPADWIPPNLAAQGGARAFLGKAHEEGHARREAALQNKPTLTPVLDKFCKRKGAVIAVRPLWSSLFWSVAIVTPVRPMAVAITYPSYWCC